MEVRAAALAVLTMEALAAREALRDRTAQPEVNQVLVVRAVAVVEAVVPTAAELAEVG